MPLELALKSNSMLESKRKKNGAKCGKLIITAYIKNIKEYILKILLSKTKGNELQPQKRKDKADGTIPVTNTHADKQT